MRGADFASIEMRMPRIVHLRLWEPRQVSCAASRKRHVEPSTAYYSLPLRHHGRNRLIADAMVAPEIDIDRDEPCAA